MEWCFFRMESYQLVVWRWLGREEVFPFREKVKKISCILELSFQWHSSFMEIIGVGLLTFACREENKDLVFYWFGKDLYRKGNSSSLRFDIKCSSLENSRNSWKPLEASQLGWTWKRETSCHSVGRWRQTLKLELASCKHV